MRINQQKLTSPSGYVLVYDSAGEHAKQPVSGRVCETTASGSEFEVRVATSGEDIHRRASRRAIFATVAESLY